MKSVYLLPCILFINLFGVAGDRDVIDVYLDDNLDDNGDDTPVVQSQYCPELNCWSLKECFQHNKRFIFFESMRLRQQSKRQKVARKVTQVLPMLPQTSQHLIGSYAEEIPTQYRIKGYQKLTTYLSGSKLDNGTLIMNSTKTGITVQSTATIPKYPSISIALTPIEADFFKSTLEPELQKGALAPYVTWQYTSDENRALLKPREITNLEDRVRDRQEGFQERSNITMLLRSEEDPMHARDELFLKLSSANNKVLKSIGLLPKKRKK